MGVRYALAILALLVTSCDQDHLPQGMQDAITDAADDAADAALAESDVISVLRIQVDGLEAYKAQTKREITDLESRLKLEGDLLDATVEAHEKLVAHYNAHLCSYHRVC